MRDRPAQATQATQAALITVAIVGLQYGVFWNFDFTVDGLRYAAHVDEGRELFHPNHLLPSAMHWVMGQLLAQLGLDAAPAVWRMQLLSAVAGVVGCGCVAFVAARHSDRLRAVFIGVLLSAGFGYWNFAQEPEVYIFPVACAGLSLLALARSTSLTVGNAALLAALASLAILMLQQFVFWYFALLVFAASRLSWADDKRQWALLLLAPPALTLSAYLVVGWASGALTSTSDLAPWFLGYGFDADSGIGTYRPGLPLLARLASIGLAMVNLVLPYEIAGSASGLVLGALVGLAFAGLAMATLILCWRQRSLDMVALLLFISCNVLFAAWWESRNIEFYIPVWFGLVALIAFVAHAIPRLALGGLCIGVFLVNAIWAFGPQAYRWPERYQIAANLVDREALVGGDALITEELNTVLWLEYFKDVDVDFLPGAVSSAMHTLDSRKAAVRRVARRLDGGQQIISMELAEEGRLRNIARSMAFLGRGGDVEAEIDAFYRDFATQPVAGLDQVFVLRQR